MSVARRIKLELEKGRPSSNCSASYDDDLFCWEAIILL